MKIAFFAAVALGLTACTKTLDQLSWEEKNQLANAIVAKCRSLESDEGRISACISSEINRERSERQAAIDTRRRIGSALASAGDGLQRYGSDLQQRSQPNRSVICNTSRTQFGSRTVCD
jgi:hypothetical protein